MEYVFPTALVVAGIVNSIPATGALSAAQLERLYGLPFKAADPNTLLLMQHRAVLFGIVGGLCFTVRVSHFHCRPALSLGVQRYGGAEP